MLRRTRWILIICVILVSLVLVSCQKTSTTTSPTQTEVKTPVATSSVQTSTPAVSGNWWDKFGTPQYGGVLTQCLSQLGSIFDPTNFMSPMGQVGVYSLPLFEPDWTLDPTVYQTYLGFVPQKYCANALAESWKFTDSQTFVVQIHQGVMWQNKPPVNGREFVASDIEAHFKRAMAPGSMIAGMLSNIDSVTATDKYTVVFKFKTPNAGTGFDLIRDVSGSWEAPEWVALGGPQTTPSGGGAPPAGGGSGPPPAPTKVTGPLGDWHNVVGAGPWILTDFVDGASCTCVKNPTYFQTDPRYHQNKTPYADELTTICIADNATQLAALRTGKIDLLSNIGWKSAQQMKQSNPELNFSDAGPAAGTGVQFRIDLKPFNDIRVRIALQMALDNKTISKNFYGGYAPDIPTVGAISPVYKGWAYTYDLWPQSLKDEFAYNPEKAKQLLAEAGFPSGFKTDVVQANGPPFGGPDSVEVMQIFKSYWAAIGVDLDIRVMDGVSAENYIRSQQTDAMYGGHPAATFPPVRVIDMYWSKGSDAAMMGLNNVGDPEYDAAHAKFLAANTEEEAAAAMMAADKDVIEKHYSVAVSSAGTFIISQPYLKGYDWRVVLNWSRLWVTK